MFQHNPQGVVVVKFKDGLDAEECVKRMSGRFYNKRMLACDYWDGVTDYTVREATVVEEARLDEFGAWLEGGESESDDVSPEREAQAAPSAAK